MHDVPPFRLLGPLEVGTRPGRMVRGQLGRALAVLLLEHGSGVATIDLAGWVLGEPSRHENERMHVIVARLRRLLRDEGLPAEITTLPSAYRLEVAASDVDATRFLELMATGDLEAALGLWRGEAGEGLGLDGVPAVRRLADARLTASEGLFERRLAAGDVRASLPDALMRCRLAPERERFVALVAIALYQEGRQADALDLLRDVRTALREDRGLDPSAQIEDLELAILRHDVDRISASVLRSASAVEPDPPIGRVPSPSPARGAITAVARSGNLPGWLSSFVGRDTDVAEILQRVHASRVVTLAGAGGVGKTRLAFEVCARIAPAPPGGIWWCELAPVGDPGALTGVVAAVFGVVIEPGRTLLDVLVRTLADEPVTLVLDNCEHLIEAVAALVDVLGRRCPQLRVIATSREALSIPGEHVHLVRPLEQHDAVALFTERARSVQPTFVADATTQEICVRLDGIPLALEMAAARVRSMQPKDLAARLDERFRLLVGGRNSSGRQQTLRATVAWSHDLLDAGERRVFRRLAVFAGSFGLAAAEAVGADEELDTVGVDLVMDSLVAKSLVVAEPDAEGRTRFSLLETIRQFAEEQLQEAGEEEDRRVALAEHLVVFVGQAAHGLRGPDETVWADRVSSELDNVRAMFWWAARNERTALALGLFAPLPPTSLAEPTAYEMFGWIDTAIALPEADRSPAFWSVFTWVTTRASNLQEFHALPALVEWARRHPAAAARPEVMTLMATFHHARGELAEAVAFHRRARVAFLAIDDPYHAVRAESLVLWCGVDDHDAEDLEVLARHARALRNPFMTAFGLGAATCAPSNVLRDPQRALELLDEATHWGRQSRNPFVHRAIAGARILARTVLGDREALREAPEVITASRNINQIGVPVGALSVAFAHAGCHLQAAELIGAASRSPTVFSTLRATPAVALIWAETVHALGSDDYEQALARGASRTYAELATWLSGTGAG